MNQTIERLLNDEISLASSDDIVWTKKRTQSAYSDRKQKNDSKGHLERKKSLQQIFKSSDCRNNFNLPLGFDSARRLQASFSKETLIKLKNSKGGKKRGATVAGKGQTEKLKSYADARFGQDSRPKGKYVELGMKL